MVVKQKRKKIKIWRDKKKRKWILILLGVCIIGAGGTTFFMTRRRMPVEAAAASKTQTATVEKGNITNTIVGTGTLEADTASAVEIPSGLVVDEVKVESGDNVKKGDELAVINQASLLSKIEDTQEEIAKLDKEINEAKEDTDADTITASVSGRVKKIYTASGDKIADVMLENGALILLSLDGKMAVELENVTGIEAGDSVTVTLSSGTEKTGTVESVSGKTGIITLTDYGPELDDTVTVKDSDGKELGTGKLYIHQQLAVTGTAGTVSSIDVSLNESVDADDTLIELKESASLGTYQELLATREELAQSLQELMNLSANPTITAEFDGIVQTVNVTAGSSTSNSSTAGTGSSGSSSSSNGMTGVSYSSNSGSQAVFAAASVIKATGVSKEVTTGVTTLVTTSATTGVSAEVTTAASTSKAASDSIENQESKSSFLTETEQNETEIAECSPEIAAPVKGTSPQTILQETQSYTGSILWNPTDTVFQPATTYTAVITLTAKEGYQFAAGITPQLGTGVVSGITLSADQSTLSFSAVFPATAAEETEKPTDTQTDPVTETTSDKETEINPQPSTDPKETQPQTEADTKNEKDSNKQSESQKSTDKNNGMDTNGKSSESTDNVTNGNFTNNTNGNNSSGDGNTGNVAGNTAQAAASETSAADSKTSTDSTTSSTSSSSQHVSIMTVSPQDNVILSVNVDELDILSVTLNQEAEITFDAIEDQTFQGSVTKISNSASSSGGVTKYPVQITIPKDESMRIGMNASATITIENKEDILLIPMNALQEQGSRVFVYTSQDEDGILTGETEIETGLSDGTNVEVVSGLSEGDTVYYSRSGSSSSSETGGFMGMQGGEMPSGGFSGEMPQGGFSGEMPSGGGRPSGGSGQMSAPGGQ